MKQLALSGLDKLLNNQEINEEELNGVKMYFSSIFQDGSKNLILESTVDNINDNFKVAIKSNLLFIFSSRYGQ